MATQHDSPILIADTSALVSLSSPSDGNHNAAQTSIARFAHAAGSILVPWDVFTETVNVLGKKESHVLAVETARYLATSPTFHVIDTPRFVALAALDRFADQPAGVSFTDCVVMAVADEYGTKAIFGFDEDFAHNGYQILEREARAA